MYQICEKIRVKAAEIKAKQGFRATKKALKLLKLQGFFRGARYRTRTCDPMHVKHVLYQLS